MYGVSCVRQEWAEQRIDLSAWKGQANVRIRFYVESDGNLTDDGWSINDIAVEDRLPGAVWNMPFSDCFEAGLSNWINGGWVTSTNTPAEGTVCARDLPSRWTPASTESCLTLGRELNLSGPVPPLLTLWARGIHGANDWGQLYVRLSKDGGLTWYDLTGSMAVASGWARFQYTIPTDYCTNGIRLQVRSYAYGAELEKSFHLDAVGIGGQTPSAPMLASPVNGETVPVLRPTLTVRNAVDYQSDPLSYRFEVYSNANLSAESLVAQNPAIASGASMTSWQIDAELADAGQYWWRCRVTDSGNNEGAWSETGTFFVNFGNMPPEAPIIISPYADFVLPDANGYLVWFASDDPDNGDAVTGYQIQIATDAAFTNVLVDADAAAQPSVALARFNTLPGYEALVLNARYYWRVRAFDLWDSPSDWSSTPFIYGALSSAPYEPVTITGLSLINGTVSLTWTPSEHPVRIEYTPSLSSPQWTVVPGATGLQTMGITVDAVPNTPQGFYRVIVE